jgi:HAD superfamily hydrolase (TIGR01509 family)
VIINSNKVSLNQKTAWIFDMDGTLTLPIHDFVHIRQVLGVPEGNDIIAYMKSLSEDQYKIARQKLDDIEMELATQAQPAPGLYPFMEVLANKSVHMGILTRNAQDIAIKTLEHIQCDQYFKPEAIKGRDNAVPKPDPDGINKLLALWGKSPDEAVMVGNYIYDLKSGINAGTSTILINFEEDYFWPEASDFMISSFSELLPFIS